MVRGAKIVSLCSLLNEPLLDPENVNLAAGEAKRAGSIVCADVYTKPGIRTLAPYRDAFPFIDYFFPNEGEALQYTGASRAEDAAEVFLGMGAKNVVVKLGARGCLVRNAAECYTVPALPAKRVVDTTGAGDSFQAGFIAGLLEGRPLRECCGMGHAAARICIRHMGASTGFDGRIRLEELLCKEV